MEIVYICDGKKEDCGECPPECKHTTDINHAKNFEIFEAEDELLYYEKEKDIPIWKLIIAAAVGCIITLAVIGY